jgi:hypothetical protein
VWGGLDSVDSNVQVQLQCQSGGVQEHVAQRVSGRQINRLMLLLWRKVILITLTKLLYLVISKNWDFSYVMFDYLHEEAFQTGYNGVDVVNQKSISILGARLTKTLKPNFLYFHKIRPDMPNYLAGSGLLVMCQIFLRQNFNLF